MIEKYTVSSLVECGLKCASLLPDCKSFNYINKHPGQSTICEINNCSKSHAQKNDFVLQPHSKYFEPITVENQEENQIVDQVCVYVRVCACVCACVCLILCTCIWYLHVLYYVCCLLLFCQENTKWLVRIIKNWYTMKATNCTHLITTRHCNTCSLNKDCPSHMLSSSHVVLLFYLYRPTSKVETVNLGPDKYMSHSSYKQLSSIV